MIEPQIYDNGKTMLLAHVGCSNAPLHTVSLPLCDSGILHVYFHTARESRNSELAYCLFQVFSPEVAYIVSTDILRECDSGKS